MLIFKFKIYLIVSSKENMSDSAGNEVCVFIKKKRNLNLRKTEPQPEEKKPEKEEVKKREGDDSSSSDEEEAKTDRKLDDDDEDDDDEINENIFELKQKLKRKGLIY